MDETRDCLRLGPRGESLPAGAWRLDDSLPSSVARGERTRVEDLALLDSFGQADPVLPQFRRNYLHVQNCMPSLAVFPFRQLFVFSDVVLALGRAGGWTAHHRRTTRLRFGRRPARAAGVWEVVLGSDGCSRDHFELDCAGVFESGRLPPGLPAVLLAHWPLKAPRILQRLLQFLPPAPLQHIGRAAELGSLSGTWLGVRGGAAALEVGAHFYVQDSFFLEVVSVFHREGGCVFRELDRSQLERREIGADELPLLLADFQRSARQMKGVYVGDALVRPADFGAFFEELLLRRRKFSMAALGTTFSGKFASELYGFVVVGDAAHCFAFGGLQIRFEDRRFRLAVNAAADEELPVLWEALGRVESARFAKKEVSLPNDSYVMVENAILRLRGRRF